MKNKKLILFTIILFASFLLVNFVSAQIKFKPQVEVGTEFPAGVEKEVTGLTFANYIIAFYTWSVRAIAILAVIMIMIAGFRWVTSAGNAPAISQAKDQMISAIIGLVLAVGANLLLFAINPALVRFKELKPIPITTIYLKSYCKDLPEDKRPAPVSWSDLKTKEMYTGYKCGEYYEIPRTPEEIKQGIKTQYCYGDICENRRTICSEPSDSGKCIYAKLYCINQSIDQCYRADDELVRQGIVSQEEYTSCRRWETYFGASGCTNQLDTNPLRLGKQIFGIGYGHCCVWSKRLDCDPGWERVNCAEGGEKCMDGNKPRACDHRVFGRKAVCVDTERANISDGICCRKIGTSSEYNCHFIPMTVIDSYLPGE